MAESEEKNQTHKSQPSKSATPAKGTQRGIAAREKEKLGKELKESKPARIGSPRWWAPVMVALMLIGLVVMVLAYVYGGDLPIPGWGNGNVLLGGGFLIAGMLMTMGWK